MNTQTSVLVHAPIARRFPSPKGAPSSFSSVETLVLRVRASEIPAGIPDDANPREPNLNRKVYRQVRESLLGEEGVGSFHLKHGGIVVIADRVERLDGDHYRIWFDLSAKQGVANGNHSYMLILECQSDGIPDDQFVELKVHTGVPAEAVPDLADGLNTSMQVREESLADLRNQFDWLKQAVSSHASGLDSIAWHEGDEGEYDVREVIALLMALDPERYPLEDPVGIENTYARLSSVFRSYLTDPTRVERFAPIALEALELYEYIRRTAPAIWNARGGKFRSTVIAETRKSGMHTFPFTLDAMGKPFQSDIRLAKAAAMPAFAAFRALIDAADEETASWRYEFDDIKTMWDKHGAEVLREIHDAVTRQHGGNIHYAGRNMMLYRATSMTLELAELRRRVARP